MVIGIFAARFLVVLVFLFVVFLAHLGCQRNALCDGLHKLHLAFSIFWLDVAEGMRAFLELFAFAFR